MAHIIRQKFVGLLQSHVNAAGIIGIDTKAIIILLIAEDGMYFMLAAKITIAIRYRSIPRTNVINI